MRDRCVYICYGMGCGGTTCLYVYILVPLPSPSIYMAHLPYVYVLRGALIIYLLLVAVVGVVGVVGCHPGHLYTVLYIYSLVNR